jgi:hypothetical protein
MRARQVNFAWGTTMGFRRSDLQEAFFVPGTHPFRVWGYGTTDRLEELLGPDYFRAAGGLMQPGDLIYVSIRPRRERPGAPETAQVRMAVVMVRPGERCGVAVRLVQDFGRPDDPDADSVSTALAASAAMIPAPAVPKRGRGRPPGSRARKPAHVPAPAGISSTPGVPAQVNAEIPGEAGLPAR